MGRSASTEVVPADDAREALSLRDPDDVDVILFLERVAEDLVAGLLLVTAV